MWKNNVGQPLGTLPNDNSGASPIGDAQYNLWKANFDKPAGGGTSIASIPEPSALILAIVVFAGQSLRCRRCSSTYLIEASHTPIANSKKSIDSGER
jgi:hypothetical protein